MTRHSRSRAQRAFALLQAVVGVALFVIVAVVAVREWDEIKRTVQNISGFHLTAAFLLTLAGLFISAGTWRLALGLLGSDLRLGIAAKAYLVGQLGKYLPGSVWAFVVQMEIAARAGVPRSRSLASSVFAILVNLTVALGVAAFCVPAILGLPPLLSLPAGVVALSLVFAFAPTVLRSVYSLAVRRLRRRPPSGPLALSGIRRCMSISLGSWACYGLACWLLVIEAGGQPLESLPVAMGAVAAAMAIGFLVVVAPSGIGVREAVLTIVLSSVVDAGAALAIALVLRLLTTLADLAAAGLVVPVRADGTSNRAVEPSSRSATEPVA